MFGKLKSRWNVGGWQLLLVIITFAVGGSLCGWLARKLLTLTNLETGWLYYTIYIVVMTIIWPFCVLVISIPLGQFKFFKTYLGRIAAKIKGKTK